MDRPARDAFIAKMKAHCDRTDCDACSYSLESDMQDMPCQILYLLDNIDIQAPKEVKREEPSTADACRLLDALKKVMDVNYGRKPHETAEAYRERKFEAYNYADELMGTIEPECK